jgi:hypothetical protein
MGEGLSEADIITERPPPVSFLTPEDGADARALRKMK